MDSIIKVSPSLFFKYKKSPHWIWYDFFGDQSRKTELPELTKKLIEGGVIHEKEYIRGLGVSRVDEKLTEEEAEQETLKLMQKGVKFIYQGVISYRKDNVLYIGRPDLLEKCNGHSRLGDFFYLPVEIKYSTRCEKSEYKMQLVFYAQILEKIQGFLPSRGYFINKNKTKIEQALTEEWLEKTINRIESILEIIKGSTPPFQITSSSKETPWFDLLLEDA